MKKVLLLLLITTMVFSFTACGSTDSTEDNTTSGDQVMDESENGELEDEPADGATLTIPEFSIEIIGADIPAFTNADAESMNLVEFDAVKTSKDGSEETNHWVGISLKDVLDFAGVSEYDSLTLEADDGYTQEYTSEIVEGDVILGIIRDGELLGDSGPIQMIVKDQPSNMWVKQLSKITINK